MPAPRTCDTQQPGLRTGGHEAHRLQSLRHAAVRRGHSHPIRSVRSARDEKRIREVQKPRRRKQKEIRAERPSAAPDGQMEKRETPYGDKAAGKLESPRNDEARHHTHRKEQEGERLARRESQVLAAPEREREEEQRAGDAPYPSRPTQYGFGPHPLLVLPNVHEWVRAESPADPSSATAATGRADCNHNGPPPIAVGYG